MSETPSTRHPRELAPAADPAWVDAFVVELRLLGVPGETIGDHLVVVDTHLRESGEAVREAFGDPRGYARSLAPSGGTSAGVDGDTVLMAVLGLLGVVLVPLALGALLDGAGVAVTAGGLLLALVLGALLAGLLAPGAPLLRLLVERRWVGVVLAPVLVAVGAAVLLLLPGELVRVPAVVVLAVGLVVLAAGALVAGRAAPDRVAPPGGGAADAAADRSGRLVAMLLLPACAAVGCALVLLLRVLG
ncbi:hypothetical protein KMZ32_10710 [Phycicoccus sp. MAQZ13P-2]|uniref:hypothetical protein n=1 Tax=Phycicoccus mangrovi TaxID=2840470 RepID=UPI001C008903|nr:hypothetical protein [Phycicoccus mangrovi]MBT9255946.1 hypothetical protein [Phycicoccus mangrovi]MBT9274540.1 hypothetical protein [Phycicoccus mangrovi]